MSIKAVILDFHDLTPPPDGFIDTFADVAGWLKSRRLS
jgi:hypothetical protein